MRHILGGIFVEICGCWKSKGAKKVRDIEIQQGWRIPSCLPIIFQVVVSILFYFHPLFGEDEPILTSIFFQFGWNNQLVIILYAETFVRLGRGFCVGHAPYRAVLQIPFGARGSVGFSKHPAVSSPLTRTWSACALRFLDVKRCGLGVGWWWVESWSFTNVLPWSRVLATIYLKNSRLIVSASSFWMEEVYNSYKKKWHENTKPHHH